MNREPSEPELQRVERALRKLNPGAQLALGDGIYMRLDRSGRRRFQYRLRKGRGGQPGGTYDFWQEANQSVGYAPGQASSLNEPCRVYLLCKLLPIWIAGFRVIIPLTVSFRRSTDRSVPPSQASSITHSSRWLPTTAAFRGRG